MIGRLAAHHGDGAQVDRGALSRQNTSRSVHEADGTADAAVAGSEGAGSERTAIASLSAAARAAMPPAATVASQSPSERVSLQGVPRAWSRAPSRRVVIKY